MLLLGANLKQSEDAPPAPCGIFVIMVQRKTTEVLRATPEHCIFCGKTADSKEDLFPRWILRQVDNRDPLVRQIGDAPRVITAEQEVRIPCACQTCNNGWMSRMEVTVKKFMGAMIEDLSVPLDRQNQQNLAEWAMKCAMCHDAVDLHRPRFFTSDECYTFKKRRTVPSGTHVFAAQFAGRGLDLNGADFTLTAPETNELLAHGHVCNVMVGHVVLQVLSWRTTREHEGNVVQLRPSDGPWEKLTIPIWPIKKQAVSWPPPAPLTAKLGVTHYGHFRSRFKNPTGHRLVTSKPRS